MQNAVSSKLFNTINYLENYFDNMVVECNAWFLVLLAVLMSLAFSIYAGLQIWCIVYKGKAFTGRWKWWKNGIEVKAECK